MGWTLGVDLGTTYSAAAVARDGGADRVPLGNRSAVIPSVVCLRADGEVLVGEAAKRRGLLEPTRTAREFKRRLGDPTPLLLGGTPYGAEALIAHLLTWIAEKVTAQQGSDPDAVVLSHPANWGPYKLDLLQQAVRLAEVADVTFITEPEAAAVHYAGQERLEAGEVVAVYDFGGGTFDAAVLRHTGGGFELLGTPEGMERIGGIDFDQAVFAHVDSALGGAVAELDPSDSSAMAAVSRLRDECQLAKEQLSQDTDVDIPVLLPGLQTEVRLTRAEFESMIRPRVGETIRALDRAVRSADLGMDDVSKVLLVGGSSRIPLVGELVREETGRPIAVDAHPKFAIAIGAAVVGREGASRATPDVAAPVVPVPDPTIQIAPLEGDTDQALDETASVPTVDAAAPIAADETARIGDPDGTPGAPDQDVEPTTAEPATPTPAAVDAVDSGADGGTGPTEPTPTPTPTATTKKRRRSLLLVAGGVLGLLVVLAVVRQNAEEPTGEQLADVTPSEDAGQDTSEATGDASGDDGEAEDAASDEPSPAVDPDATINGWSVTEDGTIEVALATAGYEVGDSGYGANIGWVDEFSQPIDGAPYVPVDTTGPWQGFNTLARPVPASGVCVQAVTPEGDQPVEDPEHCTTVDESVRTALPGERFVWLDEVAEQDGTYVVQYTPWGYEPQLGDTGTWHVHFYYWPTSDEDGVGANIDGEQRGSWAAWDAPVFDAFAVADRPADATHICGVVAEYDHTILLQEDGTGYPSGTCVALS